MEIDCPHGWKRVAKLKTIAIENSKVEIYGNACNNADRCGITYCEYYDVTREGTRQFLNALAHSHTLEGSLEERARKAKLKQARMSKSN